MKTANFKRILNIFLPVATLISCAFLCGCHVFAWYIPKKYSDKKMAEIYDYLNNTLLTDLPNYIANVSYPDQNQSNVLHWVNMWKSEDKVIINFDNYDTTVGAVTSFGVWYDGIAKEWDRINEKETISQKELEEYRFISDSITQYAYFLRTEIVGAASYSEDSYCHECVPWGFGMAQIYYNEVDGKSVTASWTVEKYSKKNQLPLIFDAEFSCSNNDSTIRLDLYGSPYGIEERIQNILDDYEQAKLKPYDQPEEN